jgi:AAA+ superfamily predicted ATPase
VIAANVFTRPETIGGIAAILAAVIVALRMTRPSRNPFKLRGSASKVRATTAGGAGGETPFQVDKADGAGRTVTFSDVAGLDEAKAELRDVVEYLSHPQRFQNLGAQLPQGILLYGMPGCGKTLLARALAGETGVPFYFVSATSFVEKFVGLGAARVRQLFEAAKRDAPCIIFIDELDAVGRHRNADVSGEREFDHTLNQLLVELDGFAGASGVLILGATNRPELIDPALLRPGRFDRRIRVDRPDRDGREKILNLHAMHRPVSRRVDWGEVAANTAGLTAAELASIVNESCLLAARRHRDRVGPDDVEEAMARVLSGTHTAKLMGEEEKQLVSVHEAGHAVLSVLLRGVTPPPRVSIISRANAFGRSPWWGGGEKKVIAKQDHPSDQLLCSPFFFVARRPRGAHQAGADGPADRAARRPGGGDEHVRPAQHPLRGRPRARRRPGSPHGGAPGHDRPVRAGGRSRRGGQGAQLRRRRQREQGGQGASRAGRAGGPHHPARQRA